VNSFKRLRKKRNLTNLPQMKDTKNDPFADPLFTNTMAATSLPVLPQNEKAKPFSVMSAAIS